MIACSSRKCLDLVTGVTVEVAHSFSEGFPDRYCTVLLSCKYGILRFSPTLPVNTASGDLCCWFHSSQGPNESCKLSRYGGDHFSFGFTLLEQPLIASA